MRVRQRSLALSALSLVLIACATATTGITRQLDADTRVAATGGATFTAPKGWFVTTRPDLVVLEDPGRTFTVTFVDVTTGSGVDATAAAWAHARPGFARGVLRQSRPAPDPWDESVRTEYQTTTAESRLVWATARRAGATWHVVLFDGPRHEIDRRAAQINTVFGSMMAPGLQVESWRGRTARPFDPARAAQLDAFVDAARTRANVPGAAIALVQRGRVVYEKAVGVRDLGASEPVTPDTLFMIGSISKPLTSLMMAALVDRGRLRWNTPVAELLPSFALGDTEATRRLTIMHTVCACTGLPRQDMEMFFGYSRATPESRVAEMKTMVPTTGFGETFQYSNPLVAAGGYIAARAFAPALPLGASYDRAMQELVFDPLGMTRTTTDFDVVARRDHAKPHALTLAGRYTALGLDREGWLPAMRPAGGVWSSARDMARYVQLELGRGVLDGNTIVSAPNVVKRREVQVRVSTDASYALALYIDRIRGVTVIGHGGATSGFSATLFFLPDHDAGGVVLTNGWGAFAFTAAVRARVLELLFDGRERAASNLDTAMTTREQFGANERPRIETAPPRDAMSRYVGTYDNVSLGRVVVRLDGDRAIFDAGEWRSALGRRIEPDGTVKLVMLDAPWAYFELVTSEANGRPRLTIERPQMRYVFEQRP